ncbi:unnamed protein product [Anisakis simplex]|uniref:Myb domain-containing protein n=1 Tax=Anisakis simplex TaxID=6269 RepID=A0A0M3JJM9_ANISI|nr:unnamed protein product [Anisakis simplex]
MQALLHLGPTLVTLEAQLKNSNSNNNNNTHNHTNDGNLSNGKQMTLSKMKSIEDYSECSDESIGSESENGGSPVPDLAMQTSMSTNRNGKPKSAISQIHECALQMRMNVEFEVGFIF